MAVFIVLASSGVIALSLTVLYVVLIIGIRKGDRRHLANAPRSNSEAIARCLLGGVRYLEAESEETEHGE